MENNIELDENGYRKITLKGLENGDLSDPRYTLGNQDRSENIKAYRNHSEAGKQHSEKISIITKAIFETEEGKLRKARAAELASIAVKKWVEENPEHAKENARKGGLVWGPIQGKRNVESGLLDNIRPLAADAFQKWAEENREILVERGKVFGKLAAKTNMERGNFDKLAEKNKKRRRETWANKLRPLLGKEFLPAEARALLTHKQWHNARHRSDMVIKLDKMGGYHNTQHYYILNEAYFK